MGMDLLVLSLEGFGYVLLSLPVYAQASEQALQHRWALLNSGLFWIMFINSGL